MREELDRFMKEDKTSSPSAEPDITHAEFVEMQQVGKFPGVAMRVCVCIDMLCTRLHILMSTSAVRRRNHVEGIDRERSATPVHAHRI